MSDTTNTTENMEQVTEQEKEMQEAQASGVVNFDDKKKDKEDSTQVIPVFMVPSVSRWMCWMRRELLMITVLVSVHSAVRQVLCS